MPRGQTTPAGRLLPVYPVVPGMLAGLFALAMRGRRIEAVECAIVVSGRATGEPLTAAEASQG